MNDTKRTRRVIDPVDLLVGRKLRQRRNFVGMSQTVLADGLGVTFQQVQKYEKGTNRIGASRLQRMSEILGVPIGYFFENDGARTDGLGAGDPETDEIAAFVESAEGIRLNRAFARIQNAATRRMLIRLVQALG